MLGCQWLGTIDHTVIRWCARPHKCKGTLERIHSWACNTTHDARAIPHADYTRNNFASLTIEFLSESSTRKATSIDLLYSTCVASMMCPRGLRPHTCMNDPQLITITVSICDASTYDLSSISTKRIRQKHRRQKIGHRPLRHVMLEM